MSAAPDASGHVWHTCDDERCNVCSGGLAMCTVCGGAEGSLLPVCPGKALSADEHDANYHAYCTSTGPFAMANQVANTLAVALRETTEAMLQELRARAPEYLPEYLRGKDPHPWDINNGLCEEFAETVASRVPGAEAIPAYDPELHPEREDGGWDCDHFVVEFSGRFYDAECHSGVDRVRDLPVYRNRGRSRSEVILDLAFLCQRCERGEDDCACIGGPFVLEREPERDLLPAPAATGAPVDERCGFVWGGR